MVQSTNVIQDVGRALVGTALLALYAEAFVLALPFVVLSLLVFDPVGAWIGPALVLGLLGLAIFSGWRAIDTVFAGRAPYGGRVQGFALAWLLYNVAACSVMLSA